MKPNDRADADMQVRFFLVVIVGAGTAGLQTAAELVARGVPPELLCIVDRRGDDEIGGTCLRRGCVPKSQAFAAAEALEGARCLGQCVGGSPAVWCRVLHAATWANASAATKRIAGFRAKGVVFYTRASARVCSRGRVDVSPLGGGGSQLRLACVAAVIATGSRARTLTGVPGAELAMPAEHVLDAQWAPPGESHPGESPPLPIAIIGGGFVSMEFAGILSRLAGLRVEVLVRGERVFPHLDAELVGMLVESLEAHNVRFRTGCSVLGISKCRADAADAPRTCYEVRCSDSAEPLRVCAVICGMGRYADRSCLLGGDGVGDNDDDAARMCVLPSSMRVVGAGGGGGPGEVYAVGDVVDSPCGMLTSVANDEATVAARHIASTLLGLDDDAPGEKTQASDGDGGDAADWGDQGNRDRESYPIGIWAPTPYANTGGEMRGEEQVRKRWRLPLSQVTTSSREGGGVVHLSRDGDGVLRVVGVELVAPAAPHVVQGLLAGGVVGRSAEDFARSRTIHPTSVEYLVQATRQHLHRGAEGMGEGSGGEAAECACGLGA